VTARSAIVQTLVLILSDASSTDAGMGCCAVLNTWLLYFGRSLLLHLLGVSLTPATVSLILHRLVRRIRLKTFACMLKMNMSSSSSACVVGAADKVGPGKTQNTRIRIGENYKRPTASTASPSASVPKTTASPTLPPRLPMPHSRSKTTSQVDLVGRGKRLSLQFPIQPATGASSPGTNSPRSRPSSWVAPSKVLSPESETPPSETEILGFLAAQERYVLELKEELSKAEADLQTLKKHYANHEANKRRNSARKVAQLQPVNTLIDITSDNEKEDEGGSNTSMQKEMERRKALLSNTKSSQRKVFSGSRHLRTLSLLSPDKAYAPSFPQPLDVHADEPVSKQPEPAPRSSTSSDRTKQLIDIGNNERYDVAGLPTIQREQLIRAGTQMANDFKNGLFTFIEDIRQATVGDEAANGDEEQGLMARDPSTKGVRKPSSGRPALSRSASSKKSTQRQASIGDDFWKENGLSEPKTSVMHNKKTHTNKPAQTPQKQTQKVVDEEEEWDNWETPNDTSASKPIEAQDSSDESDAPSSPGPGSSRTSTRYHSKRHDSKASSLTTISSSDLPDDAARDPKRNSIPWPDLVKLSPNNLKRTASHLMKEWEKQLTPPAEARNSNHSHGDYIGRSDSPSLI
jgi:hypothetical protein